MRADLEALVGSVSTMTTQARDCRDKMSTVGGELQTLMEKRDAARAYEEQVREEVRQGEAELMRAAVGVAKALQEPTTFLRPVPGLQAEARCGIVSTLRDIPLEELHHWVAHHAQVGFSRVVEEEVGPGQVRNAQALLAPFAGFVCAIPV